MSIHVTKTRGIYLTPGELSRYRYEYQNAFRMYCGPIPTFEEFVESQERMKKMTREASMPKEKKG